MPSLGFDYYKVACLYALSRIVTVESLPRILETDFKQIGKLLLVDTLEVIIVLQFAASLPVDAHKLIILFAGDGTASAAVELYIFVLVH